MAEQENGSQKTDSRKSMKVLAIVATKGKQAAMTGYCMAKGFLCGLNGYAVDMEQIKKDSELEVHIAKQQVEYMAMMTKLKAQALSKDPAKKEMAKKQLAYAKVIDILANTGLEMLGVSAGRMMLYKRDVLTKQKLDAIKKPEQKLTRAQQLNADFIEASPEEEQLRLALTEALQGKVGLEGTNIREIVDSVLRTKVSELTEAVADTANVGLIGKMVSSSLFGKRKQEESESRVKNEKYAENVVKFTQDVEASSDAVSTIDNQVDLAALYVECKKQKNMDAFYAKVEALYTEAFALNNLEVNPHYKSKVGQKGNKLGDNLKFIIQNVQENMGRGRSKANPQKA